MPCNSKTNEIGLSILVLEKVSLTDGSLNFVTTFQTLLSICKSEGVDSGGDKRRDKPNDRYNIL